MLPNLPTSITRLHEDMRPEFMRTESFGPGWFVIGPASLVIPGEWCRVFQRSTRKHVVVRISKLVAERVVHHRPDSRYGTGEVRYVLASIMKSSRDGRN